MSMRTNKLSVLIIITALVATVGLLGTAHAQKASVPKPVNKLAIGEDDIKQLLPLMDSDKHGKVSREQYMKFMEAEFDRLDQDHKGELDVRELTQSKIYASRFVGK
jgi:hypothetical protein